MTKNNPETLPTQVDQPNSSRRRTLTIAATLGAICIAWYFFLGYVAWVANQ